MAMKLYTEAISPNCRRAEATLHHLGFAEQTEFEIIDFTSGYLSSDEFKKVNPNGKVPVLIHDEQVLWESLAIMHYLAGLAADEQFMPTDNLGRADVIRWQLWETVHFNRAIGAICWETLIKSHMGLGEVDEETVKQSQKEFHRFAVVLENHMEGQSFILGDNISIVDFSVASHSALILNPASRVPIGDYPLIERWLKKMETHPSWAKTAPKSD